MYELTKLASLFVYPLGAMFLVAALGLMVYRLGRRRSGLTVLVAALAGLWICSMPVTADTLTRSLEKRYTYLPVEEVPIADAVVVLGGGAFSSDPGWPYPSAGSNVARYWHGARLYHAGRANKVVLSGAGNPRRPAGPTEAQLGAIFLSDLGVPAENLVLDNSSRTTWEHVGHLVQLLEERGLETFLLVTSAAHMRRAEAVFRSAGLEPVPVATDFTARTESDLSIRRFIPNAQSLSRSTTAVHEYVGFWFYRARGWI